MEFYLKVTVFVYHVWIYLLLVAPRKNCYVFTIRVVLHIMIIYSQRFFADIVQRYYILLVLLFQKSGLEVFSEVEVTVTRT